MTTIKLSCGFETEIDEDAINDVEMLEELNALQEDSDPTAFIRITKLFGMEKKDRKRLYEALKDENGRTPVEAFIGAVTEIFTQLNTKKK